MRLAFAFLIAATMAIPAVAQQTRPRQQAPATPPAQAAPPSPPAAKPTEAEEVLRQRILLREKFNKGWDIQAEDPRQRAARCKSEARQRYSALRPIKRRNYIKNCVRAAGR